MDHEPCRSQHFPHRPNMEQAWKCKLGDLGTMQVLLAMFYSIVQWNGPPRKSMASLAANHSLRLQKRRAETRLVKNENSLVPYEHGSNYDGEIVELECENNHRKGLRLNFIQGEIVLLEDQNQGLKTKSKGALRSSLLWNTKLVTCPVGEPLSSIIAHDGPFSAEEATRCCRDCLAALRSAKMANILHGDIRPENIMRITDKQGPTSNSIFVLISWGHAVLEDRDSPVLNLQFSSAYALQHGKLCPSSDVESLVTLSIFFVVDPCNSKIRLNQHSNGGRDAGQSVSSSNN
ncbi:hypothetical protein Sango_0100400 [Sesamum angolense]|uniref:Fungal-type protein kinase domain-containing protein n=1 Tax=Sesamum angolense TaxID=2727404 RepID=A0AAE1XEK0_9LAMI|nr:hypothetical protein Sango_0100400 [Sesamum angolense]